VRIASIARGGDPMLPVVTVIALRVEAEATPAAAAPAKGKAKKG